MQQGMCEPWPTDLSCCPDLPDDVDPATVQRWAAFASMVLWGLSGRRWGPSCPVTVRPCARSCLEASGLVARWGTVGGRWVPYIGAGGGWYNASICSCKADCSCTDLCEVWLEGPVHDITEVWQDGVLLDPAGYRVDLTDRGSMLVRTDGGCWPDCSDMAVDCDQPGAFCVTYRVGLPLDEGAVAAVSELTCELIKACLPDCHCRLPGNVRRVVRQGVVVEMADPTTIFRTGRTGLPVADLWLSTVNPHGLTAAAPRVYSTNLPRPRVT